MLVQTTSGTKSRDLDTCCVGLFWHCLGENWASKFEDQGHRRITKSTAVTAERG